MVATTTLGVEESRQVLPWQSRMNELDVLGVDVDELAEHTDIDTTTETVRSRLDKAPRAAALLDEALGFWHGTAFAEFADDDFARAEAARLEELLRRPRPIASRRHSRWVAAEGRSACSNR